MKTGQLSVAPPPAGGRLLDARLSLLDRQVLDVDGEPVGVLDDLDLTDVTGRVLVGDEPAPQVRSLVHGPVVLVRIFGGRRPHSHLQHIAWDQVGRIGSAVELAVGIGRVERGWLEAWLRDNVIGRIPGGRHVPR